MITVSDILKKWKNSETRTVPMAVLYDIAITDSLTLRLVESDPTGNGSLTYNGNVYTAASIKREESEQNIEGDIPSFRLAISNISGVAGGFIEKYELDGRKVTITQVYLGTLSPADAFSEVFEIQDQEYDRGQAVITLGEPNFFKRRVPWKRFTRPRCQHDYENRFRDGNGCGFPSDLFEADTLQFLDVGATTNAEQQRLYGWFSLNALKATLDVNDPATFANSFDVDISFPGALTIATSSQDVDWSVISMGAPFLYKKLVGDFEVFTRVNILDSRTGFLAGILCQEEVAGLDSWILFGRHQTASGSIILRIASALNGVMQVNSDSAATVADYLKMKRTGNLFELSYSTTYDSNWTLLASKTLALDAQVRLGLCVAAPASALGRIAAAFDFFQFRAGGVSDCLRTLDDCRDRHLNTHRILAFPGIPLR